MNKTLTEKITAKIDAADLNHPMASATLAEEIIAMVSVESDEADYGDELKDAERYRYLRNHPRYGGHQSHRLEWYLPRRHNEGLSLQVQLDECIDEAIRNTKASAHN